MSAFRYATLPALLLALCLPAALTASAAPAQLASKLPGYVEVDLLRNGENQLMTPVAVNGSSALFGVDTGAPVTTVDLSGWLRFKLETVPPNSGIPPQIRIWGHPVDMALLQSLSLGSVTIRRLPVALLNLATINHGFSLNGRHKERLDGIVGLEALTAMHALLDCAKCRLFVKQNRDPTPDSLRLQLAEAGYIRIPMERDEGHLLIQCRINGMACRLIVDTGSFGTLINRSAMASLGIKEISLPLSSSGIYGQGGKVSAIIPREFLIGSVSLSPRRIGMTDLSGELSRDWQEDPVPVIGLFGGELLGLTSAVIDFSTLSLYVKPV